MASNNGRWVLVEFVGGPSEGGVARIMASTISELTHGLVELVNKAPGYRPRGLTETAGSLDRWADRERAAIVRFDSGSPELYLQMVWNELSLTEA